ncbi:hypothetical protein CLV80_105133 [Yoonia maritima]|uniref:Uncharacterized protein n=2 Tax=Yoonia maritima TaxID=1435347 RepID=A0A2T0VZN9_9RHOB|nr:hypothetical protein CLV80_105133 [Yoonia maritima]
MKAWEKRQQFADRLSKLVGIFLLLLVLMVLAIHTTALSVLPFPKSLNFQGSHDDFVVCFEKHAKLAVTDGVTSYRRDIMKPENRIRLGQVRGFLGPSVSRVLFVDTKEEGYQIVDGYYESSHGKSRPVRKYDWLIVWLCGTGIL